METSVVRGTARRILMATAAMACCIGLATGGAFSQNKQTQKFQASQDNLKKALEKSRDEIKGTMALYNELLGGEAKKPDQTYKKLVQSVDKSSKSTNDIQKQRSSLEKEAVKFYQAWEKEIATYSDPSFQEKGQQRMAAVKGRFDAFVSGMEELRAMYEPFFAKLNDQVLFLGRDLSPEALGDVSDMVTKQNADADALIAKFEEVLVGEAEAPAELEEETMEEGEAEGEPETGTEDDGEPETKTDDDGGGL
jgi:hypothetical protein